MPRKTLTQLQNLQGTADPSTQSLARRLQASNFPGGLSGAEKKFTAGAAGQDPEQIRQVLRNTRKANEGIGSLSTVSGPRKGLLSNLGF